MEFPEGARNWDADGLPKYIIIALREWKSRTKAYNCKCPKTAKCNCGFAYKMFIHRNYLDSRFCPVTWLLMYWHYSHVTAGPIFQQSDRKNDNQPTGREE